MSYTPVCHYMKMREIGKDTFQCHVCNNKKRKKLTKLEEKILRKKNKEKFGTTYP